MKYKKLITIVVVLIIGMLVGFVLSQYFLNESIGDSQSLNESMREGPPADASIIPGNQTSGDDSNNDQAVSYKPSDNDSSTPEQNQIDTDQSLIYENDDYGFEVSLPIDWENFQIITGEWEADVFNQAGEKLDEKVTGPKISIRHPDYTEDNPTQDIPILVLTHEQWDEMQDNESHTATLHIGAAPIGPSLLASNDDYVFALPARYNFYGYDKTEEVDNLINEGAVKAIEK